MFISATINEVTREIKWDKSQVAAVDGDYAVNGFKLTCLGLDPDYNLTTGTWYAVFTAQDGTSHSNPLTVSGGVVTWEFDYNINKGGSGVVKFFLYAVTANTAGKILKRWDSAITDLRVAGTIDYENQEEEAARESEIDRLAGLVATLTATAATINDVKAVLSRITNSSPVVVATVADLSGLDVTEYQLAIVRADGYLYYYDGSEWQQGIKYGSYELDTTLTESGKAADAAAVGAVVTEIKEDLSDLDAKIATIDGAEYIAANELKAGRTQSGYKLNADGYLAGGSDYSVETYRVVPNEILYLNLTADGPTVYDFLTTSTSPSSSSGNIVSVEKTAVNGFVKVPSTANYIAICKLKTNETNEIKTTTSERTGVIGNVCGMFDRQEIVYASANLSSAANVLGSGYVNKLTMSKVPITDAGYLKVYWRDIQSSSFSANDLKTLTFVVCRLVGGTTYRIIGKFTAQSVPYRTNIFLSDYYVDGKDTYYVGYYGMGPTNMAFYSYGWFTSSETFSSADELSVGAEFERGGNWNNQTAGFYPTVVSTNKRIHDEITELRNIIASNRANEPEKYVHFSIDDCTFWTALIDNAETYSSAFEEPHLALYKSIHDAYGFCITLNMFCAVGNYSIENLPSTWAAEFAANADWLKFAYHAEDESTYLSNLTVEEAVASYAKFVNGIYTMTGTTDAIDRITRLGFFDGSKANCLALRDCACGIVGLLCADDNRNSYYLTSEQSEFVRTHAYYRDYENQLIFINTIRRFEYFTVTGAAELLTAAKGNINRYIEFFTHEAAATNDRFTPFVTWAIENGYKFGFMQQILRV